MVSILKNIKYYVWDYFTTSNDISKDEEILRKYLRDLKVDRTSDINELTIEKFDAENECIKRTGTITNISDNIGIIDDKFEFSLETATRFKLKVNDIVSFMQYKNSNDDILFNTKIVSKLEGYWHDSGVIEESQDIEKYDMIKKVIVTKVLKRDQRIITVDANNIKFSLDSVISNFIPIVGDWIELSVKAQNDTGDFDSNSGEILQVLSIRSVRSKIQEGVITKWSDTSGEISNIIFTDKLACVITGVLNVGDRVVYDAIESDQGSLSWRALSIALISTAKGRNIVIDKMNTQEDCHGIFISNNFDFGELKLGERKKIEIEVRNDKSYPQILTKACFHSKLNESQIRIHTPMNREIILRPKESTFFSFECYGKFAGFSDEVFVFKFKGFKITRVFKININDPKWNRTYIGHNFSNDRYLKTQSVLKKIQDEPGEKEYIRGVNPIKPPPFVKLRIQSYKIPTKFWDIYFKNIQTNASINFLSLLKKEVPELCLNLDRNTYREKFHHLLYLEEIQQYIRYKTYDLESAHLIRVSPYLSLEIEGLSEKRPSLQIGDTVRVSNPWCQTAPLYQAYIHKVNSDNIYLKFCEEFHSKYNGESVSVEFYFSRAVYQKGHFAIDLSFSHLGVQVLFPDRLIIKDDQINILENDNKVNNTGKCARPKYSPSNPISIHDEQSEKVICQLKNREIKWFNKNLNDVQKRAVKNILLGKTRPLPYIIFGPPGTGKTVTLVEVIMQLLCLIPESRLLIATPSNSAANLIAERLITCGNFDPGSLIRLVSTNYSLSCRLPEILKPYCATINISTEDSNKSTFHIGKDGIQHGCGQSYIGRHRLTIGTAVCMSSLVRMGFPAGHFTHVLVDEAGQATEPEIMMALTFIDKSSGQIILSGDPLQLGPVVMSNYASKLGLCVPYLERLLSCFPYQKDFEGHGIENCGYDPRLVTKLIYNYRSLNNVINLSNKIFYDNSLVAKIDEKQPWVEECSRRISRIFEMENPGIIFYGVRGSNYRGEEEPSWYNPQEASTVMVLLCKLYKNDFTSDDIGVITPYNQQVKYLHGLIDDMCIPLPKIASVEEFQGQERKIIILSTVRSNDKLIPTDIANLIGFINNAKRVNVSLTRAQILLVIVGNPHLLALDPLWCTIIQHVVDNKAYIGCDLPVKVTTA